MFSIGSPSFVVKRTNSHVKHVYPRSPGSAKLRLFRAFGDEISSAEGLETVDLLEERFLERRSELGKTRKSPPCALLSLAGLQEGKKEPKGAAEKNSPGQTKRVRLRRSLKTMENALTHQGKSCATVHHALDELDPGHLPFGLSGVGGVR